MSALFSQAARRAVTDAIARAEGETSAEIVVVLRHASGSYRAARMTLGAICAVVTLAAMLFVPTPFALPAFVIDVVVVFLLATWVARYFPAVERVLTPAAERDRLVRSAASAAFLERGVHRCKGRNGILVYASALEHAVEIVADLAVDVSTLAAARSALEAALRAGDEVAFAAAVATMGETLKAEHPRREDDIDELSNLVEDDPSRA